MSDEKENLYEQASAFQKIWGESFAKLAQVAFTYSPESAPPELLRQLRSGIFQALGKSWEEYMRSPQFLDSMKQMMDQAISFRKATNEVLTRAHQEIQGTSQKDVEAIMVSIHHMEVRLLDCMEELSGRLDQLEQRLGKDGTKGADGKARPSAPRSRKTTKTARKGTSK